MLGLIGMGGGATSLMWHHAAGVVQGALWVWGNNTFGEMMMNFTQGAKRSSPVQVGTDTTWSSIIDCQGASGGYNSFAAKIDGTLWVAGSPKEDGSGGMQGMTGLNNTTYYSSPTQLPGVTWTGVVHKSHRTLLATKTDGTLWSWGDNAQGMLGLNEKGLPPSNQAARSSPTQIGTDTNWKIEQGGISGGQEQLLAIKQDGTLWTWGKNDNSGMGNGQPSNYRRSSPTQIGTDTTWAQINAGGGGYCQMAIKTNGSLWAWGIGGGLGLNAPTSIPTNNSPLQVGTDTTWANLVAVGGGAVHATKTDGTLWAWGNGDNGNLGHNNRTQYSSPKQVGNGTNWKTDYQSFGCLGNESTGGIKTDGTLWMWGSNSLGQLAQNQSGGSVGAAVPRSSPTQVPGTNWLAVGGFSSSTAKTFAAIRK